MIELYQLYLRLFACASINDAENFDDALDKAMKDAEGAVIVERLAVGALAAMHAKSNHLADFYGFQQAWERYRNTEPRK